MVFRKKQKGLGSRAVTASQLQIGDVAPGFHRDDPFVLLRLSTVGKTCFRCSHHTFLSREETARQSPGNYLQRELDPVPVA